LAVGGAFDALTATEPKARSKAHGMSVRGLKADLVAKLALRRLKVEALAAGRFDLASMTVPDLRQLQTSLGVKGTVTNKSGFV
jgi:hypothetical protein